MCRVSFLCTDMLLTRKGLPSQAQVYRQYRVIVFIVLQYVELLRTGHVDEALSYLRRHLAPVQQVSVTGVVSS